MALQQKAARIEQPGAELLEPATRFFSRYGRIVLGAVAVLIAAAAVTFFTLRARAAADEQAAGRLAEANIFYWQGDYPRALQLSKQIYEQYGSTASGNDAHRLAGDAAFWSGDFKNAIAEYRRYLERTSRGLLADAARRSLAYALESDRQFDEAARAYEALVGKFDRTSSGEFLMASARAYRDGKKPDQAIERLQRLVDEFGDTPYGGPAVIELSELKAAAKSR
ncbi:MAG TPA: tetratricopeptide repeat protein [Candidatus Limnocylindria bacterium]|nr:tetratricopeptide repeat protein [Candidatus Limnocylindria bacterium]